MNLFGQAFNNSLGVNEAVQGPAGLTGRTPTAVSAYITMAAALGHHTVAYNSTTFIMNIDHEKRSASVSYLIPKGS